MLLSVVYAIFGLLLDALLSRRHRDRDVELSNCPHAGCSWGVPAHPNGDWVTQQARHLSWKIGDGELSAKILIRDRDSKFVPAIDEIFRSEGIAMVKTPPRSPRANSVAERWIQSARREALDRMLIFGERHLLAVMAEYVDNYKRARPHRGLGLDIPMPAVDTVASGPIVRRQRLEGSPSGASHSVYSQASDSVACADSGLQPARPDWRSSLRNPTRQFLLHRLL